MGPFGNVKHSHLENRMIKAWSPSFSRPSEVILVIRSQGALYLSSQLSSVSSVINCLTSEFLTLTPTITVQFATCYSKYESQAIGFTIITLSIQKFMES